MMPAMRFRRRVVVTRGALVGVLVVVVLGLCTARYLVACHAALAG